MNPVDSCGWLEYFADRMHTLIPYLAFSISRSRVVLPEPIRPNHGGFSAPTPMPSTSIQRSS